MKQKFEFFYSWIIPLIMYGIISAVFFGWYVLPDISHTVFGMMQDNKLFIWCLKFWPYAVSHGQSLFLTDLLWPPYGINLTQMTSIPLLGFIMAPVTMLWGPMVSYNLLIIFGSALSAYAMYGFCRYLTRSFWPSFIGGYLFGFSTFEIVHTIAGHVNWVCLFLVPLIALCFVLCYQKRLKEPWFVLWLTLLLMCEFLISKELYVMLAIVFIAAGLVGFLCDLISKQDFLRLMGLIFLSYVFSLILVSPFIYYFLFVPRLCFTKGLNVFCIHLEQLVIPMRMTWLLGPFSYAHYYKRECIGLFEMTGYLGFPLVMMFVWYAYEFGSQRAYQFLAWLVMVCLLLSFGMQLHVGNLKVGFLPWVFFVEIPVIYNVLPARFSLFTFFILSMVLALWLQHSKASRFWKVFLTLLMIVFLLPDFALIHRSAVSKLSQPPSFIQNGSYKSFLKKDSNVLFFPLIGFSDAGELLYWQLETDMGFKLAAANVGGLPSPIADKDHIWLIGFNGGGVKVKSHTFIRFLKESQVDYLFMKDSDVKHYHVFLSHLPLSLFKSVDGWQIFKIYK